MSAAAIAPTAPHDSARGFALGLLGVVIFALTLPMTRLAVGDASAPQLPPAFVTANDARTELEFFFSVLHQSQPALIGGKLPDAGFYAGVRA